MNNEYVIRGNSAILKCSIPSFVSDFVNVVSWQDDSGNSFARPNEDSKAQDGINAEYALIRNPDIQSISNTNP